MTTYLVAFHSVHPLVCGIWFDGIIILYPLSKSVSYQRHVLRAEPLLVPLALERLENVSFFAGMNVYLNSSTQTDPQLHVPNPGVKAEEFNGEHLHDLKSNYPVYLLQLNWKPKLKPLVYILFINITKLVKGLT